MKCHRRALIAAGSVSAFLLMASPAVAADELLFSADGETWGPALAEPMFEDAVLVPGDQVSRTFWVRNGSGYSADLAVAVDGEDLSPVAAPGSLWVTAAADSAASVTGRTEENGVILSMPAMDAAQSQRITVTVGLGEQAPNAMQQQATPVRFQVNVVESLPQKPVTDPAAPGHLPDARGPGSGMPLADTGFMGPWIVALGASLVAGGWLAVTRSRSRKTAIEGMSHGTA